MDVLFSRFLYFPSFWNDVYYFQIWKKKTLKIYPNKTIDKI